MSKEEEYYDKAQDILDDLMYEKGVDMGFEGIVFIEDMLIENMRLKDELKEEREKLNE